MLRQILDALHDIHSLRNIGEEMSLTNVVLADYQETLHMPQLINVLVSAAEREGGISQLRMLPSFQRWRDSICDGYLWYMDRGKQAHGLHGTHCIKLTK